PRPRGRHDHHAWHAQTGTPERRRLVRGEDGPHVQGSGAGPFGLPAVHKARATVVEVLVGSSSHDALERRCRISRRAGHDYGLLSLVVRRARRMRSSFFRCFPFVLIQLASLTPALATPPSPDHPIVGTWYVYVTDTDCVETWEIRADGTTHNFSGAEESFS